MSARALAIFIGLAGFGGVAYAAMRSASSGPVDGIHWDSFHLDLVDAGESIVNSIDTTVADAINPPQQPAPDWAAVNERAVLATIIASEGTDREADPYRVTFGYGHTIQDLSDHPYYTGEWKGAPFGNGQWSTAAGAYQIIRGTWAETKARLALPDFSPASQDAAALELIRRRGALEDVRAGRFAVAMHKLRREWASLPGAGYGQGERSLEWVAQKYQEAGGQFA